MDILDYEPGFAEAVCDLYNRTTEPVVHCYPIDTGRMEDALRPTIDMQNKGPRNMRAQRAFVAVDGKTVIGFAHAGILVDEEERTEGGAVRFLTYELGMRSGGVLLLDRVEAWLRNSGAVSAVAFHQNYRLSFYHYGPAYLSDRIGHVQALLASRGYEKCGGEVFLDDENFGPRDPEPIDLAVEVTSEEKPGHGKLPGLKNLAWINGKEIGTCSVVSSVEDQRTRAVEDRVFVEWLSVDESWQGKGIGRYLLQRTLNDAYARGYRRAGISTAWDNHLAFVFYSNFGFSVSDWTYAWGKGTIE